MFHRIFVLLTVLVTSFVSSYADVSEKGVSENPVQAEMFVEKETVQPGTLFSVAIRLKLDKNWHVYWKNPGDSGMAPSVDWQLPRGYFAKKLLWPIPQKYHLNETYFFGYEDEVVLLAEINAPKNAQQSANIEANLQWIACNDSSCLPGNAVVSTSVPVSQKEPLDNLEHQNLFATARKKIPTPCQAVDAKKRDGLIALKFDIPEEVSKAEFFPDEMGVVDPKVDAVVAKEKSNDTGFHVILKEAENADRKDSLKGVVVLESSSSSNESPLAYEIDLPVSAGAASELAFITDLPNAVDYTSKENSSHDGLILTLIFAFLGGLLLNLMPCVLPVISFKILSFVKMAQQSRKEIFKHGLAFAFGIVFSFWILAGALLSLQAYGTTVGWGFQLQEPLFVAVLSAIILVFGLSMFGVFEMGTKLASIVGQTKTHSSGVVGSFLSGVLATAVATPCTGPFLGPVVGLAVTLSSHLAMLVFTFLGMGLAFPYLMLGAFPSLLKFLPKPGNWMITFKEIMGFLMLATVLWLVWVFDSLTDTIAVIWLLLGFLFLAISCWIFGKWGTPVKEKTTRLIAYLIAIPFLIAGCYTLYNAAASSSVSFNNATDSVSYNNWEAFSKERLNELIESGTPMFIDFTAKWCLICQTNHATLVRSAVEKEFEKRGVIRMKADWTKRNSVIAEELKKYGRNSVPLYLLFTGKDKKPIILPQVLTQDVMLEHLKKIDP